jgi:hypothetical protein
MILTIPYASYSDMVFHPVFDLSKISALFKNRKINVESFRWIAWCSFYYKVRCHIDLTHHIDAEKFDAVIYTY